MQIKHTKMYPVQCTVSNCNFKIICYALKYVHLPRNTKIPLVPIKNQSHLPNERGKLQNQ